MPQRLDSLVIRLLEKKPENRFQNVAEVKEELSRIAAFPLWGTEGTSYVNRLYGGKSVDREKEYQTLQNSLKESLSCSGKIFLIEGEFGIGKSDLLKHLKRESQIQGILFVQINCPKEETYPLQPLKELFRRAWPFFLHLTPSLGEKYGKTLESFLIEGPEEDAQMKLDLERLSSFLVEASNLFPLSWLLKTCSIWAKEA